MSDELLLLAALWPLRGPNAREAEAWGVRLTGPERTDRLARGDRRRGFRHPSGRRWRGLVTDSEDLVVAGLEGLGWTLIDRRPPSHHMTVLIFSRPVADPDLERLSPRRTGLVERLVKRVLL